MNGYESIPGLLPGEVESYDGASRTCRVRIPGVTDGSTTLPVAVFLNALGDRAAGGDTNTEIRILPGDPVWLMFEGGDPRFPIIMGYRTPRAGNPVDWRRWHHKNIELTAEDTLIINARNVVWNVGENVDTHIGGNASTDVGGNVTEAVSGDQTVNVAGSMASTAASSTHEADTHDLTAQTTIHGAIVGASGPGGVGANLAGPVAITGSTVTHDGHNIGSGHTHDGIKRGLETSNPPNN